MGSSFFLPSDLRAYLEDYGICTLAQARNNTPFASGYWFTADDLDLCGDWKTLWENYVRGLEYNRIRLNDLRDKLLWSHSNFVGPLTAAKGYDCIILNSCLEERNPVIDSLWTLNIPTKIACFIWLLVKGRILTWEQLQSRGFHGPSRCVLCERNSENILHLFLVCPFTVNIFSYFATRYGFSFPLFSSVQSFLVHWFSTTARSIVFRYFPLFTFWSIWLL